MDTAKIIQDLRIELNQVNTAIVSLERLARGAGPRRGRPPKWAVEVKDAQQKRRGRPLGSKNQPKEQVID